MQRSNRTRFVAALVVSSACGSPTAPSPVALGTWGGNHISMLVTSTSTHVELDCAHGDWSGALAAGANGEFTILGTFVREHGGPIRIDEIVETHPARYTGAVSSSSMSLT